MVLVSELGLPGWSLKAVGGGGGCGLVLRQASLPDTITVPWREGRTLRYQYD
jgi:hypothetical protein